jgi:trans-2,3-dihydro-3-hydroxyanthranilate isomerase
MAENEIDIMLVDTFTTEAFAGNPAGVVLDGSQLTDQQMQKIANEIQVSETAFMTGREQKNVKLRFFTPQTEVDFCGHAALAAVSALVWNKQIVPDSEVDNLTILAKSGLVPVEIHPHPVSEVEVALTFNKPRFAPFGYSRELLSGALGVDQYQLPAHWPLSMVHAGVWSLVVPISTIEAVDQARPDYDSLARLNQKIGALTTMLYTWQGPVDMYCRCFAPAVGVNEDPVTGTGLAATAALVVKERAVQLNPPLTRLNAEQGTHLGRTGNAKIDVAHDDSGVQSVRIAGTAVKTMEGRLRLP